MKKQNIYKILTIGILVSIVLSYFIPGTTVSYGAAETGTIMPVTFVDTFTNGLTSLSAFLTNFVYILVIGIFYAVLKKTGKYESLVNNIAVKFNKNKGLFIVLCIFGLGLFSLFTNDMYVILIFVPLLISIIKKLGYAKETSLISTIGAILVGQAGAIYTYYINQMASLTVNDNLSSKIFITLIGLVSLVAFVLVFNNRPESTKDLEKIEEKKMLPLHIILWTMFVLLVLGFVNWNALFKFEGFDKFLESVRGFEIAKVSVFDIIIGKTAVAFGAWQSYNAAVLFIFITIIMKFIYKIKISDLFETFANGLKKAFPYALVVVLANIILVNTFSSGFFYTIVIALTKKSVSVLTGTITSILAALFYPDYGYATQFSFTAILNTSAKDYQNLIAVLFQAVYSIFLLISPTSILLLMGLKYNDIRYKDWFKYIYKFFGILFITVLVAITLTVKKVDTLSIVATSLLVVAVIIIFYMHVMKIKVAEKEKSFEKKETKKEEVKEVEVKKTTAKKENNKKSNNKKKSKK
ncbi:MAG: hypothetical protein IKE73_02465 [Bacilli bacterium]|nr:hypothetical protein [Bacilli bacterium]